MGQTGNAQYHQLGFDPMGNQAREGGLSVSAGTSLVEYGPTDSIGFDRLVDLSSSNNEGRQCTWIH